MNDPAPAGVHSPVAFDLAGRQEHSMDHELTGGCLCGDVRYRTRGLPERITVCHCRWCQHRTGSAFGVECVFERGDVVLSGESLRAWRTRSDESGRWLEQDFCSRCGTNIGLRLEAAPTIRSIAAGSLDDPAWLDHADVPVRHVFMRSRTPLVEIPAHVERHEEHFRR